MNDALLMDKSEGRSFSEYDHPDRSKGGLVVSQIVAIKKIERLNFDGIKAKLCLPANKDGKGWSQEKAKEAEKWYRRFLTINLLYGDQDIAPCSEALDDFWHYHILDTQKYHQDCQDVFGYYLHHVPCHENAPTHIVEKMYSAAERTIRLFRETYDEIPESELLGASCNCRCTCCGNK